MTRTADLIAPSNEEGTKANAFLTHIVNALAQWT